MLNINYINILGLLFINLFIFASISHSQEVCLGTDNIGKIELELQSFYDASSGVPGDVTMDFAGALFGSFEQMPDGSVSGGMDWFTSSYQSSPKPGAQSIVYWSKKGERNTKIQVTNNGPEFVELHLVFRDENCLEIIDFCDTFTPDDTHVYDLESLVRNSTGTSIPGSVLDNKEGFLLITPTDDCSITLGNTPAIGYPHITSSVTIDDSLKNYDYTYNGFNRTAITDGCTTTTTEGIPILDGASTCRFNEVQRFVFGSGVLQQANMVKEFSTLPGNIAARSDLIIINFEDDYSAFGITPNYATLPANAMVDTPSIFDEHESPTSCVDFENACFTRLGLNEEIQNSDVALPDADMDGVLDTSDNCPMTANGLQSDVDGDGVGDLCDDCPSDPADMCETAGSTAEEVIAEDGGTVETPDGNLILEIPPDSLASDETISVTQVDAGGSEVDLTLGAGMGLGLTVSSYDLQPDGTMFDPPATLTIIADVSSLNAVQRANLDLYIFNHMTSSFEPLGATCVETEAPPGTFTAECTAMVSHFTEFGLVAPLDADNDGVPDNFPPEFLDECLNSDTNGTVVIDGCDSGVVNIVTEEGCTILDLVGLCAENARNHGRFVSCVSGETNQLKKDGKISGREKGRITSCAARSDIP